MLAFSKNDHDIVILILNLASRSPTGVAEGNRQLRWPLTILIQISPIVINILVVMKVVGITLRSVLWGFNRIYLMSIGFGDVSEAKDHVTQNGLTEMKNRERPSN